ncbi:MAG TPA: hypothetical protein VMV46_09510 [Thermoanaerobaculia bacterium]|nr:hypothetical protein [Thermoanaerobaculia bacterium]
MRRRIEIFACLGLFALGGVRASAAEIPASPSTPQTPRSALGADPGDLPDIAGPADAAFAAWLRTQANRRPAEPPPTLDEIKTDLRQHNRLRALLGENRWRRLERARFQVHLYHLDLQPHREFEQVSALYDDIESSMRSNFGKIARDWAEHRLGLAERFETWEQRRDDRRDRVEAGDSGMSLRFSPRFGAGDDPYLGTKIRLRNAPRGLISHLSLNTRYHFDHGDTSLRLTWQTRDHYVSLEQVFDDRYLGDVLSLSMRFTF